jgi:putative transposase
MTDTPKHLSPIEIPDAVLEELLKDYKSPEDLLGPDGLMKALKKRLIEKALGAELTAHLGYEKSEVSGRGSGNSRNGASKKTVKSEEGAVDLSIPRDRNGTFEPQLIRKGQTRIDGFDDKILSMYARGMSVREIQGHLQSLYGVEISPDLISRVTDAVLDDIKAWQNRALEPVYPVVIFDALRVKIRDEGFVKNKAVYLALAITPDGRRDVLGIWVEQNEGAKFWLKVMNELKNRGLLDILIAVVDGLKGFPEAIQAVFPQTTVQTCIVHLVRHSLNFCSFKDKKAVAADLKNVYRAETADAARERLEEFDLRWGAQYPSIAQSWRRNWEHVIPFFAFPQDIRRIIYTTNAIESLNASIRKIIKTRGSFPTDESAIKLIWLAIQNAGQVDGNAVWGWKTALNQFAIVFNNRMPNFN